MRWLLVLAFMAGVLVGYGRRPHCQDANELIRAGFTITDPEGFEVEAFGR
jgi:hypothetical protein